MGEIDAEGLRAVAAAKGEIKTLSGERIQKEMLRTLAADASGAGACGRWRRRAF